MNGRVIVAAVVAVPIGVFLIFFAGLVFVTPTSWGLSEKVLLSAGCTVVAAWCFQMSYRILFSRPRADGSVMPPGLLAVLSLVVLCAGIALGADALQRRSLHTAPGSLLFGGMGLGGISLAIPRLKRATHT